ncbi:MAG: hypothetical protein H0X50_12020 [Nitrosopumilus sp.]|nr:hypothetical protein [Nitrosopumilus sp.]
MVRISGVESDDGFIRKVENMILSKLIEDFSKQTFETSHENLERSLMEAAKYPVFNTAINNLIVRNFVSRIGNDNYRVTDNGIVEYDLRK